MTEETAQALLDAMVRVGDELERKRAIHEVQTGITTFKDEQNPPSGRSFRVRMPRQEPTWWEASQDNGMVMA